jgi:quinol monooxygenase YgiN
MITIVATLQAQAGKEDELKAALTNMIGQVKEKEAGRVVSYSLHTKDGDPTTFLFYEQYAGKDALDAHGKTEHMAALGASLAGLLAGRPSIEHYTQIAGI